MACNTKSAAKTKEYGSFKANNYAVYLHQSQFLIFPEAFALIFQSKMPSAMMIMLLYSVAVKQVKQAETPFIKIKNKK